MLLETSLMIQRFK